MIKTDLTDKTKQEAYDLIRTIYKFIPVYNQIKGSYLGIQFILNVMGLCAKIVELWGDRNDITNFSKDGTFYRETELFAVRRFLDDVVDEKAKLNDYYLTSRFDVDLISNKGIKYTDKSGTDIEFYEFSGKCPVEEFLNDISNKKLKVKTVENIVNLSKLGNNARPPLSKYVDDGIYELRTKFGKDLTRVFYFFVFGNKIILTNGYIKDQKKMDTTEFDRAKKYMNEYIRRKQGKR